jgi:hypothetical protein
MTTPFSLLWEESRGRKRRGSSGGKPKMQLPQSKSVRTLRSRNPHGRNGGYVSDRASRVRAVVKSKFVMHTNDSQRHIIQHVFYIAERNQQKWEHRRFFSEERMDVPRDEVIKYLSAHQGRDVSMHKVILSPGDNSVNLVHYARESMNQLDQTLGYKVDWFAVEHTNTDHYHVHVVIPGKIPEQERQRSENDRDIEKYLGNWAQHMEGRDLRLYRHNLDNLREAGNEFLLRERSIDRALDLAIEKELGLNNWTYDRYVERALGLRIWHQDKDYERELGLTSPEQDYLIQKGLGLDPSRSGLKDPDIGKYYDLGRPFLDDRSAGELYALGQDREQDQQGPNRFDSLASQMFRDGTGGSGARSEIPHDPLETNLPKLIFNLQGEREHDPERDRVEDGLAYALYQHQNPREESASINNFEMQLLHDQNKEDQDKERDDDDERHQFKGGSQ